MNKKGFTLAIYGILFVIIAIIILLLVVKFGFLGSLGLGSMVPDKKQTFVVESQGIIFNGQTAILGELTEATNIIVCGGGSGSSSYSNNYNTVGILSLSSSMSVPNTASCGGNYIWIEGIAQSGELNVVCFTEAIFLAKKSGASISSCKVYLDNKLEFESRSSASGDIYAVTKTNLESFERTIEKNTKIKILLETQGASYGGSASVKTDIKFLPASIYDDPMPDVISPATFFEQVQYWFSNLWNLIKSFFGGF